MEARAFYRAANFFHSLLRSLVSVHSNRGLEKAGTFVIIIFARKSYPYGIPLGNVLRTGAIDRLSRRSIN